MANGVYNYNIVVYVQKFFVAIKILEKNKQSLAEVRFMSAREPGTRAGSQKRYTSASWAG